MSTQNKVAQNTGGVGFLGLLGLLFIGLKLTGFINWSWWWVLLPIYGPIAVILAIVLIVLIFIGSVKLLAKIVNKRKRV